jgi:two-component system sensor histidine kinase YesM
MILHKNKPFTNAFQNMSLHKKIILIVILSFFFLCIAFLVNLHFLTKQYDNDMYNANAQLLNNVISNIESEMSTISSISNYVIADTTIQENLTFLLDNKSNTKQAIAKRNVYETLYMYLFSNNYIKSISFVTDDSIISMGESFPSDKINLSTINQRAIDDAGRVSWSSGVESNYTIMCVREMRQLKFLKLRKLAILYINVDMDQIITDALLDAGYSPNLVDFIILQGNEQIYPNETSHDLNSLLQEDTSKSYHIDTIDGQKKFIISGSMRYVDWNYYYFRDYNRIFNNITRAKYSTLFYTFLFSLIALLLTNFSLKSILKHLDYLVEKITQFGAGITKPPRKHYHYENRNDEIGVLHNSFDQMTQSVKVLRDENYDKQILLKDTTIKMLEQQINPHFLYNTLDTINWMAQMHGAEDISTMALSLGNLFRASIAEQKDLIFLENELEFLNSYIQIQKIRFKERLQFDVLIPKEYNNILIPKLCIQPLVENALIHSMEYSDETCIIQLSITEEESKYLLKVANTGSYFVDNLLQKLEQNTLKPQGSGVGLSNINSRMKLIYGENYGLSFYNHNGMAIVVLSIPKAYTQNKNHNM